MIPAPSGDALKCERSAGVTHPLAAALTQEIRREFPRFKIVPKLESRLQKFIGLLLRIVTAGAQHRYVSHYHTVMGDTLFVPKCWECTSDRSRVILLRHERVHLRQRRRYGSLLFVSLYLFPFFPMGLAYGRARLEWEAYRETLIATYQLGGRGAAHSPELRCEIIRRFTGGDYGWMWPFPATVGRWYDEMLLQLDSQPD